MKADLTNFLIHYNLYRRHGSLRKELKVKTPFNAVERWYQLDPEIFKQKPLEFKNKILSLYLTNKLINKLLRNNLVKLNT